MRKVFLTALALLAALSLGAQKVPEIFGLSGMTVKTSSPEKARDYFGRYFGLAEAFRYESDEGLVLAFKVNDRQFIQAAVNPDAGPAASLLKVSVQVASASSMHDYLQARGWAVGEVMTDGAGEKVFSCLDADGNKVEFVEYQPKGKHLKCIGRKLSKKRISDRIINVGLPSPGVDSSDPFWVGLLGCREILRAGNGKRSIHYLSLGSSLECIEHYNPCKADFAHPCFLTLDMQATIDELRSRGGNVRAKGPGIGMTRRWLFTVVSEDGIKVEFTEPFPSSF